jgi:hypothetical protein
VNTYRINAGSAVGDFPGIDLVIVIVGNKLLDGSIEMEQMGVTNLSPSTAGRREL